MLCHQLNPLHRVLSELFQSAKFPVSPTLECLLSIRFSDSFRTIWDRILITIFLTSVFHPFGIYSKNSITVNFGLNSSMIAQTQNFLFEVFAYIAYISNIQIYCQLGLQSISHQFQSTIRELATSIYFSVGNKSKWSWQTMPLMIQLLDRYFIIHCMNI